MFSATAPCVALPPESIQSSRQDILAQNKRFLATPLGSFTALPLLCCMCLKGSRHSYTHAPCTESAVIALKQYLEVAWVYIYLMRYVKHFQCTQCHTNYPIETPINLCPKDNRPVRIILDMVAIKSDYPGNSWYYPEEKSMWRFGPLLPFDKHQQPEHVVSLGEGYTPVIDISDYELCKSLGLKVVIKDEGQAYQGYGANPTGSFKDRGMSMVATMAKHYGLKKLTVPTQGNAGDSLTAYGISEGFEVAVVMPDDTPLNIMGSVAVAALKHDEISIDLVKGTIREAGMFMNLN